ncbi:hypothetical protein [Nocardioides ungokensis]|uniref:hypothetical protein n=1 Tax=Nocardioides ungokensis TaxID=1643322 RepID=UPI001FE4E726|nr:hypothetical protein [Nocardioides ungokensis]
MGDDTSREVPDLRMPALGAAAWLGGLLARWAPLPVVAGLGPVLLLVLLATRRRLGPRRALTALAVVLVLASVAWVAGVRQQQVTHNPVAALAADQAFSSVEGVVTGDPRVTVTTGPFGDQVLVRLEVRGSPGAGRPTTWRRRCW